MADESKLAAALREALAAPTGAAKAIRGAARERVRTVDEAELVVRVLERMPLAPSDGDELVIGSPLNDVLGWLQSVEGAPARAVLRRAAAPELLRIFDVSEPTLADADFFETSDVIVLLRVVCLYAVRGGLERVVRAARSPHLRDASFWSTILDVCAHAKHPWRIAVVDALREPLPEGRVAGAYLDLANRLALAKQLARHPFDSDAGATRLTAWIEARDREHAGYAHSATAAIPFLAAERRPALLALADAHPDRDVQLEAAWAAATCGDARGLETLRAAAVDPRSATRALAYLAEVAPGEPVPIQTRSPDFLAQARMCDWLGHPREMGRPPDELTQVDTRELYWPPTRDRRRVWLFRYHYAAPDGGEPKVGHGMVGSVTFALFGEDNVDLTAEEVYALHCAWELKVNRDPRAPAERTVEAGLRILAEHNPDIASG